MKDGHGHCLKLRGLDVPHTFPARFWALSRVNLSCRSPPAEIAKDIGDSNVIGSDAVL